MAAKDTFEKFRAGLDQLCLDTIRAAQLPAPIKKIIESYPSHDQWRLGLGISEPTISTYEACKNCAGTKHFSLTALEGPKLERPKNNIPCRFYEPHKAWYVSILHIYPCPVCSPGILETAQASSSGLSQKEWGKSLAKDFLPMPGKEALRELGLSVLADRYPSGWITLHGEYGVGKSHWMQCMVADFIRQGITAKYITMVQILSAITDTFGDKNKSGESIIAAYAGIRVLAIDEIDRVPKGSWHMSEAFKFLDLRYRASVDDQEQLTIMALNENVKNPSPEFEQLFGYLKSRMSGGMIVEVGGDDMRPLAGDDMNKKYTGDK